MNQLIRLKKIFEGPKDFVGEVSAVYSSTKYLVTLLGGGSLVATSLSSFSAGDKVYIRGTEITGVAPDLPQHIIEV